jgi:hypothetical protein
MSNLATTPAKCLSRSTSSTELQGHPLDLLNLQPKNQSLHSCGVNHIRTGEIMSSHFQYKTYRDLNDIKLTEFSQIIEFSL